MKKISMFFLVLIIITTQSYAWEKTYDRNNDDDYCVYSVKKTLDNGYIMGGASKEPDWGLYLVKTDSTGNFVWEKFYDWPGQDICYDLNLAHDDGFVLTGQTELLQDGYIPKLFLAKTDSLGNTNWLRVYNTNTKNKGRSVIATSDGGYIVAGSIELSTTYPYIVKTDADGYTNWTKVYTNIPNAMACFAMSIAQTSDNGYIICGSIIASGFTAEVLLIKTDSLGNITWVKTFGDDYNNRGECVHITSDNGYVICGSAQETGISDYDVYLIKTDNLGNEIWSKTYGGNGDEDSVDVKQTLDGGYIIGGKTYSFGAGGSDLYLIKTDSSGNIEWEKAFGDTFNDFGGSVEEISSGNYIFAGGIYNTAVSNRDFFLVNYTTSSLVSSVQTQFIEINPGSLSEVYESSSSMGDIDNDGDLDLVLAGLHYSGSYSKIAKIYQNDGTGSFTEINPGSLEGVNLCSTVMGDIDNDGDLDLILSGTSQSSGRIAKIYQNDGLGNFSEINPGTLLGLEHGSMALGDLDNDGDLDLVSTGSYVDGSIVYASIIYYNNGQGCFNKTNSANLKNVNSSSLSLGDIDNDHDLDIILTGCYYDLGIQSIGKIYQNDGTGNFTEINPGSITPIKRGDSALGDLDGDSDLDLIIRGEHQTCIYQNDGTGNFTEINPGSIHGTAAHIGLGDIDNDGDLDLVLTGEKNPLEPESKVYFNDGNSVFTEMSNNTLRDLKHGCVVMGDINNDGDLDLILSGRSTNSPPLFTEIYENQESVVNQPPSVPTGMQAVNEGGFWKLIWNPSTDDHTPANDIYYNIAIGTNISGDYNYKSSALYFMRGQANVGNVPGTACEYLTKVSISNAIYWKVCAIDSSFKNSVYCDEQLAGDPGTTDQTPPCAVQNLRALSRRNHILLRWNTCPDLEETPDRYDFYIYRGTTPNFPIVGTLLVVKLDCTSSSVGTAMEYKDETAQKNTVYYYKIITVDKNGLKSEASAEVSARYGIPLQIENGFCNVSEGDRLVIKYWVYDEESITIKARAIDLRTGGIVFESPEYVKSNSEFYYIWHEAINVKNGVYLIEILTKKNNESYRIVSRERVVIVK